jgi:micrococcal nuclease
MFTNYLRVGHAKKCLLLLLTVVVLGTLWPSSLQADIYKWIDEQGNLHFTDNLLYVPQEYRDGIEVLKEKKRKSRAKKDSASLSSAKSAPQTRWVRVEGVIDGDTIVLANGEKVRYLGIDTPETKRPNKLPDYCGQEAFAVNRSLVSKKEISLEFDVEQRDQYGRLLAYVFTRNLFVNAELIRRGYAQVSTYLPNVKYRDFFLKLQRQAIARDRGLWGGCKERILTRSGERIIGNERSKVYHLPGGAFYDKVGKENRVYFDSVEQAEQAGYRRSRR